MGTNMFFLQALLSIYINGITPQGTVSFISDGLGGRNVTEQSTLLSKLVQEDRIIAELGFNIHDSVDNFP